MATALAAPVTCAVVGSLSAVYAVLQFRVASYRLKNGISLGANKADGTQDATLTKLTRVGGNLGEYLPIGAILLLLLETATDLPQDLVAAYGGAFALFRLLNAFALQNSDNPNQKLHLPPRKIGMRGTILTFVSGGAFLAFKGLKGGLKALRKK